MRTDSIFSTRSRRTTVLSALSVLLAAGLTAPAQGIAGSPGGDHAKPAPTTPAPKSSARASSTTSPSSATKADAKPASTSETKSEAKVSTKAAPANDGHAPTNASDAEHDDDGPSTKATTPPSSKAAATKPSAKASPTKETSAKETTAKESSASEASTDESTIDADAALKLLQEGNARWVSEKSTDPNTDAARRTRLASAGQKPFAAVVSCADSRVPLERVFDRGVGEVFAVRVAGNVAGDSETGTLEYGVGHLKTPLLVVMGHTKCGAVAAAASGAQVHGKIRGLVDRIAPAVERAKRNNPGASESELASLAVKENVWQTVYDLLKNSDDLRNAAEKGEVRVVGAVYDISTGKVEWLGSHPWQAELLGALRTRDAGTGHGSPSATTHAAPASASADGH
jgi:carbonic anhydrase